MYSVRRIHRTAVIKEEDPAETVRIPDRENRCRQITAVRQSALRHRTQQQERHRLQREQRGRQQKEHRADVRKETKDRTEMKEQKEQKEQKDQTETTTEITAAATDAAVEETDVVIVRKEEADRDSREATVHRMAVPTEIRETAITDMTTTVVMTDRDANSEKNQITEEMTEEITQAFRLLQSKDRNHRERMPREKTITRRKIIVVMMKKECQRVRRKTSRSSSFRNHSRKSRR